MERGELIALLRKLTLADLWTEIGRRHNVNFGKVQMAFHGGRPSDYVHIDERRVLDPENHPRAPLARAQEACG